MNLNETIRYPNGTVCVVKNGKVFHIHYHNGDKIWFDTHGKVIKLETHDGIFWKESDNRFFNANVFGVVLMVIIFGYLFVRGFFL